MKCIVLFLTLVLPSLALGVETRECIPYTTPPETVNVHAVYTSGHSSFEGIAGGFITPSGTIATVAHITDPPDQILSWQTTYTVIYHDCSSAMLKLSMQSQSTQPDLALFITDQMPNSIQRAQVSTQLPGLFEEMTVSAVPLDQASPHAHMYGIGTDVYHRKFFTLHIYAPHGYSGRPVFDAKQRVRGIIEARNSETEARVIPVGYLGVMLSGLE